LVTSDEGTLHSTTKTRPPPHGCEEEATGGEKKAMSDLEEPLKKKPRMGKKVVDGREEGIRRPFTRSAIRHHCVSHRGGDLEATLEEGRGRHGGGGRHVGDLDLPDAERTEERLSLNLAHPPAWGKGHAVTVTRS
jgi:hypothetical protein